MRLDPALKTLLSMEGSLTAPHLAGMPLATALAVLRREKPPQTPPAGETADVEDRLIPGPDGNRILLRIYRPRGSGPYGLMLHFHGGGWAAGSVLNDDLRCHITAIRAQIIVISVDYRLAPEHKFPAGLEDGYAALCWAQENAAAIGGNPSSIALSGASAGGNLAASCAMLTALRHGPRIACQILSYPVCDTSLSQPSHHENADAPLLTPAMMAWFIQQYLPPGTDPADPRVAILNAPDFSPLPASLIITAECDPLRDEGAAYASRLNAACGLATHICYGGMVHGFITRAPALPQSQDAMARIVDFIRKYL